MQTQEESQPSTQPSTPRRPLSQDDHSSPQQQSSLIRRESLAARVLSRFQKQKKISDSTLTTDNDNGSTSAKQDGNVDDPSYPNTVVFKIPASEKKKSTLSKLSNSTAVVIKAVQEGSTINMQTMQDYIFDFDRIFIDKNMFKAFYNYLETEHNTEPLEFVQQVNELEMDYYKLMRAIKSLTTNSSNSSSSNGNNNSTGTSSSGGVGGGGGGVGVGAATAVNSISSSGSTNNLTQAMSVQSFIMSLFGKKEQTHFQTSSSPTSQDLTNNGVEEDSLVIESTTNPTRNPNVPSLNLKLSSLTKKDDDEAADTASNLVKNSSSTTLTTTNVNQNTVDSNASSSLIPHSTQQNENNGRDQQQERNASPEEATSALSRMALPSNTPRSKQESINSMKRKIIMSAIKIMKEFIEEDSKKEINISSRDKTTYVNLFWKYKQYQNFDEWVLPQLPHLLFRTVKNSVLFELENDSFPRFVRSELWFKCVQQQGVVYLNKIGRLKEATFFPYTDDDFKLPMVFDRDIEFMEYLARDDYNWKLIGSTKEPSINVYKISGKMLFPNVEMYQKMQTNKWWGILPHPFAVRQCCMPGFHVHRYDPNITSCEELAYYDFETLKKMYPNEKFKRGKRSVSIIRYGVCFPFPFKTKRSFLSACTSYYDKNEQKLTVLYKPCEHEKFYKDGKNVNEGKKHIDIRDFQFYQIKKLDSHRTIISQIHLLDVGGNARPAINMLRMDRAKGMMKGFNEYIRKNINNIPEISPNDPVWKTVVECMGKEDAHKLDLSATLYNDLTSGRNISNMSLVNTIKKYKERKRLEKKQQKKKLKQQQHQQLTSPFTHGGDLMVPSSSSNNTASESSNLSTITTTRGDISSTTMSPEMIIQEEEEAMLTVFDADLENFSMTGTDKDESDDEMDEDIEEDEMVQ
nr:unnamed protein product [Naegleria fowleri]